MSASAPRATGVQNPAKRFIKWKAGANQGHFEYYDKTIEDKAKRNIKIDLSKGFYILDEDLFSITGYIEPSKTGIVSNAVRSIDDQITVKGYTPDGKSSILLKGTYAELKEAVKSSTIYNYTKDLYIMFEGELCHIALSGAAFASWLAGVQPNANRGKCLIRHSGTEDKKKGIVDYKVPVFEVGKEADEATWAKVIELDSKILQPYLEVYLAKGGAQPSGDTGTHSEPQQIDTTKWREQTTPAGVKLGEMTNVAIQQLSELLVEEGKDNTPLYDYVGQALYDYQAAMKVWDQKADSTGKKLSDYTLDELKAVIAKIGMMHKYSIFVQAAIEAKAQVEDATEPTFDDDENIPF